MTDSPAEQGGKVLSISGWQYRAAVISAVLAAFGYLAVGLWSGWQNVVLAVRDTGVAGIGIALLLSLVNYGLRFCRWHMYLAAMNQHVPGWTSLRIYLAGFALTTTPGKVGELLRSALLLHWAVPLRKSVAAFFTERLSDLLAIVLLALPGLAYFPGGHGWVFAGAAALVAALIVLPNQRLLSCFQRNVRGTGRLAKALRHLWETLLEASRCNRPTLLAAATTLSVVAWSAEGLAFHIVLERMGETMPLALAVSIYAMSMLAGALSFMPGGLGGAEAVMVGLLVWHGMDAGSAVAATLIIRLTTLWFAVVIGGGVVAGYAFGSRRL